MEQSQETFLSHLIELRDRLIRCLLVIGLALVPAAWFSGELYDLLARPVMDALPQGSHMIATGGIFAVAAVVTPPDVVSLISLAVPMCLLYEAGIFFAQFIQKRAVPRLEEPTP